MNMSKSMQDMQTKKIIVIKYGGSSLYQKNDIQHFLDDIFKLKALNYNIVIVHGGGKNINELLEKFDLETKFYQGLRITDDKSIEIIRMSLALLNQELCLSFNQYGFKSVGLTGIDASMLDISKKTVDNLDLGFVGDVINVKTKLMHDLINNDMIPIIAPIANLKNDFYNINADEVALQLAVALQAESLVFLSDIDGLYLDYHDKDSIIHQLSIHEARKYLESGVFQAGMYVKMKSCIDALKQGIKEVNIINGNHVNGLYYNFLNMNVGTKIKGGIKNVNASV